MYNTYLDKILDDVNKGNTDTEILSSVLDYYFEIIVPKDYYTIKHYMNEIYQKLINITSIIESKKVLITNNFELYFYLVLNIVFGVNFRKRVNFRS